MTKQEYSLQEVADFCGVSLQDAKEWHNSGKLKGFWEPLGEQFIFSFSENQWFHTFLGVPIEEIKETT